MFPGFPPQYIYLASNLFLFAIWSAAFLVRRDLRKKMMTMGLLFIPLGPISELFYRRDYWQPLYALGYPFIIEDLLFGFLAGSGASCVYQVFTNRTTVKTDQKPRHLALFALMLLGLITLAILNLGLGINSIWASVVAFSLIGFIIITQRPDLRHQAIGSSLLTGGSAILFYAVALRIFPSALTHLWLLNGKPEGVLLFGLPLTEIVWSGGIGLGIGPLYEFWQGAVVTKRR